MVLNEERIEVELLSEVWRKESGILIPIHKSSVFNRLTDVHRRVYAQALTGNIDNIPESIRVGVGAELTQAVDVSNGPVSLIVVDTTREVRIGSTITVGGITDSSSATVDNVQGNTITLNPPLTRNYSVDDPVVLSPTSSGLDLQNEIFSKDIPSKSVVNSYYASYYVGLTASEGLVGGATTTLREFGLFNSSDEMLSRVTDTITKGTGDVITLEFRSRILP